MRFTIRFLIFVMVLVAVTSSAASWWLRVSQEREALRQFDPFRAELFDVPDEHKAKVAPVIDELRARLMDAAWFGDRAEKLSILRYYAQVIRQMFDRCNWPEYGYTYIAFGNVLGFPDDVCEELGYEFDLEPYVGLIKTPEKPVLAPPPSSSGLRRWAESFLPRASRTH